MLAVGSHEHRIAKATNVCEFDEPIERKRVYAAELEPAQEFDAPEHVCRMVEHATPGEQQAIRERDRGVPLAFREPVDVAEDHGALGKRRVRDEDLVVRDDVEARVESKVGDKRVDRVPVIACDELD